MKITFEHIGLFLQILGVLAVLLSQVRFVYKSWRKFRNLKKAFFVMVSVCRVTDERKVKEISEEELEKTYPEWWALATYLSEDIRDTAIGLLLTLIGLVIEFVATLAVW